MLQAWVYYRILKVFIEKSMKNSLLFNQNFPNRIYSSPIQKNELYQLQN